MRLRPGPEHVREARRGLARRVGRADEHRAVRPRSATMRGGANTSTAEVTSAFLARVGRDGVVEVLAHGLEVRVARAAAPLGGDDLPAPLADALDRRPAPQNGQVGALTARTAAARGPSATSRPAPRARSSRPRAPSSVDEPRAHLLALLRPGRASIMPASRAAAKPGSSSGPAQRPACSHVSSSAATSASRCRRRRGTAAWPTPRRGRGASPPPGGSSRARRHLRPPTSRRTRRRTWSSTPSTSRLAAMNAVQSGNSSSSSASRRPPSRPSSPALDAERLEDRIGRARVAELVLGHRGGGDGGLERRRADAPLGVAAAERGLVVGERADERGHAAAPGRRALAAGSCPDRLPDRGARNDDHLDPRLLVVDRAGRDEREVLVVLGDGPDVVERVLVRLAREDLPDVVAALDGAAVDALMPRSPACASSRARPRGSGCASRPGPRRSRCAPRRRRARPAAARGCRPG